MTKWVALRGTLALMVFVVLPACRSNPELQQGVGVRPEARIESGNVKTEFRKAAEKGISAGEYVSPRSIDGGKLLAAVDSHVKRLLEQSSDRWTDDCLETDSQTRALVKEEAKAFWGEWKLESYEVVAAKTFPDSADIHVVVFTTVTRDGKKYDDIMPGMWVKTESGWRVRCRSGGDHP